MNAFRVYGRLTTPLVVLIAALWGVLSFYPAGSDSGLESRLEEVEVLRGKLESLYPKGAYILIDSARNRLYLKRGSEVLLEAVCSTGSRRTLISGDRRWTFETPRGLRRVLSKVHNPVWRRPDWSFIELGEPLPRRDADRYEEGVLGSYALDIGDGYFIHGTLYSRLLGQNVTHGCIRLGDQDLEFLYKKAPVATRVYIF